LYICPHILVPFSWGDFSLCSMDIYFNSWGPLSTQLAICSKCSIAISSWPYLQDAISSSPPLQLSVQESSQSRVRIRSEYSSQSAHTLHYVRTHPGTIAERSLESKQKRLKSPHVHVEPNLSLFHFHFTWKTVSISQCNLPQDLVSFLMEPTSTGQVNVTCRSVPP
jgi:hypothetical protein